MSVDIAKNLKNIRDQIESSRVESLMASENVSLIAVSKTKPVEDVLSAYEAGHRVFGENKVQEAQKKFADLEQIRGEIELHLIGPLQTNKAKEAVETFDVIQTVDRPKLVNALAKEIKKQGKSPELYIQVNTGEESQKAGVFPGDLKDLIALCHEQDLRITGLMCIPPVDEEPSLHFSFLSKLAKENGLPNLSMGMSSDFDLAVRFGATHVRVGSGIFGSRDYTSAG
ncbi:YggS family pyridoxal phosphate-dependent enzyme [uncultured Kiloniella sp.]|uniref:YggS family pyridoxal phosphate-dependent enzyme n=1 Tax=uncultured Kiloniella sp. TaxID=1133091 RepID=UPI00261608ED|nr:YggS family pyridoxal phosphate-dependent enzyme [uncultured Kiloniella sp.]